MNCTKSNLFSNLKYDLPASMVVFLVALPLCLGIALASGAPLFAGIISGIVGGIVVALISDSPLGVSGPAAGLAVIVVTSIEELGFDTFLYTIVIAGIIQIIFGFIRAGVIGYYFPSAVIKGMLSGIGIIIILKQIPHAFGYDKDPEGDFSFSQMDGHNTFSEMLYMLNNISVGAIIITVVSLLILILWDYPFMKKKPIFNIVQGPLIVVLFGIGFNLVCKGNDTLVLGTEHLVKIPVASSISEFISQFTFPDFSQWNNMSIYMTALTIAVVASLETLLCVEATDKLNPTKRVTPPNKELVAQGIGNMMAGLIGGLPVTQVIVRSSANIQSGGKSKASAFFHGILLLISAITIPNILNLIPLASLAAILLVVGYKLSKPSLFISIINQGKSQSIPFIVTVLGIVFTNMLVGISLGLVIAILQILWNNYKTPYHFDLDQYQVGQPVKIELSEDVSFLNKAGIRHTLNLLPNNAHVIINGTKARNIHLDVIELLEDFNKNAKTRNITVELINITPNQKHNPMKIFSSTFPNVKPS